MPTYSRITINLSRKDELKIKKMAEEQGYKSLSAYCRDKLLADGAGAEEQTLDRITVETQIDQLTEQINKLRKFVIYNAKQTVWYGEANKNFTAEFFKEGFDAQRVAERLDKSSKSATDYMNTLFK